MVQNSSVFYDDLDDLKNKIMLNKDIPRYFDLDCKTLFLKKF